MPCGCTKTDFCVVARLLPLTRCRVGMYPVLVAPSYPDLGYVHASITHPMLGLDRSSHVRADRHNDAHIESLCASTGNCSDVLRSTTGTI